ncbi:BON domain-containing protein [Micromonospora avicenniae]|uniref:BON domain-containing protein n=1 Tax=Micromonospora avicenniae TaxID=1198245 RepID=A0A1N7CVT0_9ACTN|nr:BON domain-containing protein [Micromonospora avicenniae]SIR67564.1 hypothetical protein SAMN05444858_11453 [Micromonospora avicenniae]
MTQHRGTSTGPPDEYLEAEIQRALAEDPSIAEQGITVVRRETGLVLYGEVESSHRREEILRRVADRFPTLPVTSEIGVVRTEAPTQIEQLP